jgi:hypothetical protein
MGAMKAFSRLLARPWTLIAAAVVLLAAHGFAFHFLRQRRISAAVITGLVLLVIIKHLEMFGSLHALFRKRFPKTRAS